MISHAQSSRIVQLGRSQRLSANSTLKDGRSWEGWKFANSTLKDGAVGQGDQRFAESKLKNGAVGKGVSDLPAQLTNHSSERTPASSTNHKSLVLKMES